MNEYFVLAVVLVIFAGLWFYLWNIDLQVQRVKRELEAEHDNDEKR